MLYFISGFFIGGLVGFCGLAIVIMSRDPHPFTEDLTVNIEKNKK